MSDYNFAPAFKIMAGLCVAGGVAIGGVVWGATALFNHATAQEPLFSLSQGREQLLDKGFVGSRRELQSFLAQQTNAYFAQKGYPCDPVKSSVRVFETVKRGQCPLAAPNNY